MVTVDRVAATGGTSNADSWWSSSVSTVNDDVDDQSEDSNSAQQKRVSDNDSDGREQRALPRDNDPSDNDARQ